MTYRRGSVAVAALLAGCLNVPCVASAAPVQVTGALELTLGTLAVPTIPFQGAVDVTGGIVTVPAGIASASGLAVPITGYPLNLITGVVVTFANGAGQFSLNGASEVCPGPFSSGRGACVTGGGFGGSMPMVGVYQVKGALAINVPLSFIGVDGELTSTVPPPPSATSMAPPAVLQGAAWTTGTARVTTTGVANMFAASGSAAGALGAMSSTLTLVSPAHVNAYGLARLPVFTRLSLHFVPEPGSIALLGAGLAGLAVAARARGRR